MACKTGYRFQDPICINQSNDKDWYIPESDPNTDNPYKTADNPWQGGCKSGYVYESNTGNCVHYGTGDSYKLSTANTKTWLLVGVVVLVVGYIAWRYVPGKLPKVAQ